VLSPQIFITVWQSWFCGAPSLTRGRVCLLYMLLSLDSVVFLGSEFLGTRDHILLSQIWDYPFRRLLRFDDANKVKVTLRLMVSQSVNLGVEPHLGLMTRCLLLFDSYGLVFVGRPLWREDGSVFCICCWPLPAQSFSGPSSLGLATTFYRLRFETSLFVASYARWMNRIHEWTLFYNFERSE
jgi:hypothetical protein